MTEPSTTLRPAARPGERHELRFRRPMPDGFDAPAADVRVEGAPRAEVDADGWTLRWRGPALMGVLNVTPDSFSDGGRFDSPDEAVDVGLAMRDEGAMVVDVGGVSTRPGAGEVDAEEEAERVLPVVRGLAREGRLVSVDTSSPEVAEAALLAGACIVNDVRGLRDGALSAACAAAGAPAVVMHMQGEPRSMQARPRYRDVVAEVESFLLRRAAAARAAGVPSVLIDPGIGFGKLDPHNLALLRACERLASHAYPLVIGVSRKSLIGRLGGEDRPDRRLPGSLALALHAAARGAALLRVHDVAAHAQALRLWRAVEGTEEGDGR